MESLIYAYMYIDDCIAIIIKLILASVHAYHHLVLLHTQFKTIDSLIYSCV